MIEDQPPHWGTMKGSVLKAIVIDQVYDWEGIRQQTRLTPDELNTALHELFTLRILTKLESGRYWVRDDVYAQYKVFFEQPTFSQQPFRLFDSEPVWYSEQVETSVRDLTGVYGNLSSTFNVKQRKLADQYNVEGKFEELIALTKKQNEILHEQSKRNADALTDAKKEVSLERKRFYISTIIAILSVIITIIALIV